MTEITLTQQDIQDLRARRNGVKMQYGTRNNLFTRYEDIYFMRNTEQPKDAGIDKNDWKITASPGGRDKVTGLKRILDTAEIHIKVKDKQSPGGKHTSSDAIEAGLKQMLKVSGEYRAARAERDTNLAAILYGPVVMSVNSVDDLITAKANYKDGSAATKFIVNQLETIRRRTPFLIDVINSKESYPVWGKYGLVGHLQEYIIRGSEIIEEWGCDPSKFKPDIDYTIQDFFYYNKRLVESTGTTLFAGEWLTDYEGVTSIPIFVRYAGGSTLFHKPEEQLQSFLYSYAKGEWDLRENLFWTYLFTAIYSQGLPGPTLLRDPDDSSDIKIDYRGGVKIITAKGKLENVQVVDADVMQLKALMDDQGGRSTIQEQTIGGASDAATFSSYVMQVNAGKLPAIDPTEAQEQCYRDLFLHILQRIKVEGIENDLIDPADIPDDIELEVTMEPDLQQDDLRNAQIVAQLKTAGANISDEWYNANILKIPDSNTMFQQKAKEDIKKAMLSNMLQNPQLLGQFLAAAMPSQPPQQPPAQPGQPPQGQQIPPGYHQMEDGSVMPDAEMQGQPGQPNMEGMPMTDAMQQPMERGNGKVRAA
jgi:hypothetical protein